MTKVLLLYLASSLFLCSFITLGQATNELFEEDPSVALRSHNAEQLRNELAMLVNENINWDKINVSSLTLSGGNVFPEIGITVRVQCIIENVWRAPDALV